MAEIKQAYPDLLSMIDRLGPIERVATDPNIINQIIAYDTDRHLLCALFDRINEAIEKGKIVPEELAFFRSGEAMDQIVNLKQTIQNFGNDPAREVYSAEILDKINYVSLLKDPESLAACYTHPEIIKALCDEQVENKRDLVWWSNCGTFTNLPREVQITIISEVARKNPGAVPKLMDECSTIPTSTIKPKEDTYHM